MKAYPQQLRERVLRALERGESPTDIARSLKVSRGWVYKVRNRLQATGDRCSRKIGGHRRSSLDKMESTLRSWILAGPTLTLTQLQQYLSIQGIQVKIGALWHQLDKWGLTYKRSPVRRKARATRSTGRVYTITRAIRKNRKPHAE